MVEQQSTWQGQAIRAQPSPRQRTLHLTLPARFEVHPLRLVLRYRVASATVLLSAALLMYLFQVNQGAWIDFRLSQAGANQNQKNAVIAGLLAQKDKLLSASRVDTMATSRFHMRRPSLNSALWLTVRLPDVQPAMKREPVVATGPLVWLHHAVDAIGDSL